jgi:hypothetical protein
MRFWYLLHLKSVKFGRVHIGIVQKGLDKFYKFFLVALAAKNAYPYALRPFCTTLPLRLIPTVHKELRDAPSTDRHLTKTSLRGTASLPSCGW